MWKWKEKDQQLSTKEKKTKQITKMKKEICSSELSRSSKMEWVTEEK